MIKGYSNNKYNSKTKVDIVCDKCGVNDTYSSYTGYIKRKQEKQTDDTKDYCKKCWKKYVHNSTEYREKMSRSLKNTHKNDPLLKQRISQALKGKNAGKDNAMKRPEVRKKNVENA